ncbi:MAG: TetR/AcrR family transcriptional regulator [Ktedonobacteraceae bacterium]
MTITPKRERLIEAAQTMFYHQGVNRTTLADIANRAQVPLGNVYYHFRTKEALVEAVIQAHERELRAMFARWEELPDPHERLLALFTFCQQQESILARYGCPHGSLCLELDKEDNALASVAAHMLQVYLDWAQAQFMQLGRDEQEAKDLAIDLISALQGTFVLAASLRAPELLEHKLQRLRNWIRTL